MAPQKKVETKNFSIDCTRPAEDEILDVTQFEEFLKSRIKVEGKVGNLGNKVEVSRDGNIVNVASSTQLSKRYLKYLTKKYLKKKQIRDWLHVVANGATSYELKYFNINNEEEAEEEEDA
eukprot:m.9405 g.9405  ORF g.9405 m.9405 type:complete len:120 (-) comp6910_c0_seq1:109-468(-)